MQLYIAPHRILKSLMYLIYENGCLYKTEHMIRAVVFWGTLFAMWFLNIFSCLTSLLFAFTVYFFLGGWKFMRLLYNTAARDLRGLWRLTRMKRFVRKCRKTNTTVGHVFQHLVRKHPSKPCLMFGDTTWTFQEVDEYSNRVGNCFAELGFVRGDEVALFMDSCPEYVGAWLGLSKIGVVPALVNSNLRLQPLVHSITVVNCKAVIFGVEMMDAMKEIVSTLLESCKEMRFYCLGEFNPFSFQAPLESFGFLVRNASTRSPPQMSKVHVDDRLFYVYTSGTTGLPKAAIIRHPRFMSLGAGIHFMNRISSEDVLYTALPLYHTAGGILSLSQTILFGCSIGIRPRFSASKFWDDCIKHKATVAQYIGELCRYLLAQPEKPQERQHQVRLMFGNGLRPQIWTQFVQRFNIQQIGELYGSTEGNANVINIDNKVGSVGFMSRIIPTIYPVSLIKVDPCTGEPIRNEKGLCIRCEPGEPGEFVGKIILSDPMRRFDGYVNQSATKKKIVKDCFQKGDMAFLSGDMLVMDDDGYLFFVDRTGDTFRWKGENVSTMEVEGVISSILGLADTVVYGVVVPDMEGRAGMAAVCDPSNSVDLKLLLTEAQRMLPAYAIPQFVRICDRLESTGTFKLKKVDLQKENFDPNVVHDPLYYLDKRMSAYLPLDQTAFQKICSGHIRM